MQQFIGEMVEQALKKWDAESKKNNKTSKDSKNPVANRTNSIKSPSDITTYRSDLQRESVVSPMKLLIKFRISWTKLRSEQECIAEGSVPSAPVTVRGGRVSAQECIFPRGVSAQGVSAQGGVCPRECLPVWVSAQGGVCLGGCLPAGVYPSMHWGRHPPWTKFLTHASENITFLQLHCGQ